MQACTHTRLSSKVNFVEYWINGQFKRLNKAKIFTLHHSAIQQIDTTLTAEQAKITTLQTELAAEKLKVAALESEVAAIKAHVGL